MCTESKVMYQADDKYVREFNIRGELFFITRVSRMV